METETLTMKDKKKISKKTAQQYQRAGKKEKSEILKHFVSLTEYSRCYASWVLRNWDKKIVVYNGKHRIILVGEWKGYGKTSNRKGKRIYGEKVQEALKKIWYTLDHPCGIRLASYMREIVRVLERYEELILDKETRDKLFEISPRTIDRLLREEKKKWELKGKCRTKPGMLLKSQIPIRTFAQWDEKRAGFLEMDLVSHDGGQVHGIYAQTLSMTDIHTGWTETIGVKNKSQKHVLTGLKKSIADLPFPVFGLDSDNGSEFINDHLQRYCEQEKITFTRSRPYRKNDSCYVEQKNWHIVRKTVGYWRYETDKELFLLNRIYTTLRLYTNFFQPQMKLIEKTRKGSKVTKKYDDASTPYQRVLNCPEIDESIKKNLTKQYESLNPVELRKDLLALQNLLLKAVKKNPFYRKRLELKKKKQLTLT
jgi:hypothetical protein